MAIFMAKNVLLRKEHGMAIAEWWRSSRKCLMVNIKEYISLIY